MTILVAGGTGFVGQAVCEALRNRGDQVLILSRSPGPGQVTWKDLKLQGLPECDGIINLAGANVMARRWSPRYKKELLFSRIESTRLLTQAIAKSDSPPKVLVNASAQGYYPDHPTRTYTEADAPGNDFLSQICVQWEQAAELPEDIPTRTAIIRISMVLGRSGGALKKMLPIFKLGLGGKLGTGKQPAPWIHIKDLVAMILFALDHESVTGPLNGAAPELITNEEFTKTLGKALGRPTPFPVPEKLLNLLLGERSVVLLGGQYIVPEKALKLGFSFQFPTIDEALKDLI